MNKRIIEDWFPINYIGEQGRLEKSSPSKKVSIIHRWHARRPVSAMRAIILSSMIEIPDSNITYERIKDFILQYSHRNIPNNVSIANLKNNMVTQKSVNLFLKELFLKREVIKALDPFAGGGAIPYELFFAGCETYATDLNPVALLINKATSIYPVMFKEKTPTLIRTIQKYATLIIDRLREIIGTLYNNLQDEDKKIIFYVWTREIPCLNEECGLIIPMFKNLKLNDKTNEFLVPIIPENYDNKKIKFKIGPKSKYTGFFTKGSITCPRCKTTMKKEQVHSYGKINHFNDQLIAIYQVNSKKKRNYRIAQKEDFEKYQTITNFSLKVTPNLKLPKRIWLWPFQCYGDKSWKELFNERQYLVASKISEIIIEITPNIIKNCGEDLAAGIVLYLQFGLDRILDYNSRFTTLKGGTRIGATWARPGLFMTGSYIEANPFIDPGFSGSFLGYFKELAASLHVIQNRPILKNSNFPIISQMDARNLEFEDKYFDLIITDPPYYNNVPYAADSDFFYIWDKKTLNFFFPEIFINPETPKEEELIADPDLRENKKSADSFYEIGMANTFSELYRTLKDNGLIVVIFAHKKVKAWESLIGAFIRSNFVVNATWPLPMESIGKLAAMTSASLTSVVLVVARKIKRQEQIYFDKKFQSKIVEGIENKMDYFWNEGIRGADFFMCAIGPSLTYYSNYVSILDPTTDEIITIERYLKFIQNLVVNFAVRRIVETISTYELDNLTQFYLIWRWGYGLNILPFDEVKKLYQALTIKMSDLEGKIIEKKKGKAEYKCLNPNDRFKNVSSKLIENFNSENIIDFLQLSCYLWEKDSRELLESIINKALLRFSDSFWIIAQALYDILPECQEATQLQGILQRYKKFKASEKRIKEKKSKQTQLPI